MTVDCAAPTPAPAPRWTYTVEVPSRLRYPEVAPAGYAALSAFGHYLHTGTALPPVLLDLVYLRASVLNGCAFCIAYHREELGRLHEPEDRIAAAAEGASSDALTPREQAALRWTAVVTQLNGQAIADPLYDEISRFFDDKDLVDLTFAIANINAWNRMGIVFQPHFRPGFQPKQANHAPPASPPSASPSRQDAEVARS